MVEFSLRLAHFTLVNRCELTRNVRWKVAAAFIKRVLFVLINTVQDVYFLII